MAWAENNHGFSETCITCDGSGKAPKCGMGSTQFPCIRPKGHHSPTNVCFAIVQGRGVYLYQDGKEWCKNTDEWPDDAIIDPEPEAMPPSDRRIAVEATRAKRAAK